MSKKITEIIDLIKEKIVNYDLSVNDESQGKVITVGDGILIVKGLKHVMLGEILAFDNDVYGWAMSLEENYIRVVLLNNQHTIKANDIVKRTERLIDVPVGDNLLGRIVDALGNPLDGKDLNIEARRPIEKLASGIMSRQSVTQALQTGILTIDALIPIGKGQRELIIGDRQTGKTSVAIDTIINQRDKQVYCVYVAIGKKQSEISRNIHRLKINHALVYTTFVVASASDSPAIQFLAPYTGITIAETWMEQGKDVLIIFDDLSKHAVAYRTLTLLLKQSSGREAYPGDIFYVHSRLLERAAKLNDALGGGSITALPIIETLAGDISAYIPTNVISITDGQIYFKIDLFNANIRPAIDFGLSVSRVGSTAQHPAIKEMSSSLKLELAYFKELQAFLQFGSDVDINTKRILDHGQRVVEILKQPRELSLTVPLQVIILFAIKARLISWIPLPAMLHWKNELLTYFQSKGVKILHRIAKKTCLDNQLKKLITQQLAIFTVQFVNKLDQYDHTLYGLDKEWDILNQLTKHDPK